MKRIFVTYGYCFGYGQKNRLRLTPEKNALKNLSDQEEDSNSLMLSLSIFVALILIDVCAALQPKSGGGRSTFIGLKYITYWIQNKNDKDCGPLKI